MRLLFPSCPPGERMTEWSLLWREFADKMGSTVASTEHFPTGHESGNPNGAAPAPVEFPRCCITGVSFPPSSTFRRSRNHFWGDAACLRGDPKRVPVAGQRSLSPGAPRQGPPHAGAAKGQRSEAKRYGGDTAAGAEANHAAEGTRPERGAAGNAAAGGGRPQGGRTRSGPDGGRRSRHKAEAAHGRKRGRRPSDKEGRPQGQPKARQKGGRPDRAGTSVSVGPASRAGTLRPRERRRPVSFGPKTSSATFGSTRPSPCRISVVDVGWWTMKMYEMFTASRWESITRNWCASFNPFSSPNIGWYGFYQERGWVFIPPGRTFIPGQVYCVDITEAELVLYNVERNLVCSDGVGDLLTWARLDDGVVLYSLAIYRGVAERVSAGCFILQPAPEERISKDREVARDWYLRRWRERQRG